MRRFGTSIRKKVHTKGLADVVKKGTAGAKTKVEGKGDGDSKVAE